MFNYFKKMIFEMSGHSGHFSFFEIIFLVLFPDNFEFPNKFLTIQVNFPKFYKKFLEKEKNSIN